MVEEADTLCLEERQISSQAGASCDNPKVSHPGARFKGFPGWQHDPPTRRAQERKRDPA